MQRLKDDDDLRKAIEILSNADEYHRILSPVTVAKKK